MNIKEFFEHVGAELVGGRVKAVVDGVHHIIADFVDGSPQLTAAGQKIKDDVEAAAPEAVDAVELAADAAITGVVKDPALGAVIGDVANTAIDQAAEAVGVKPTRGKKATPAA